MSLSRRRKFKHIYGPVSSWRLGRSLGVDILPRDGKTCTFDCVYCQLGSNPKPITKVKNFVSVRDVLAEIKELPKNLKIDYITFSGCGEPSLAGNLGELIRKIKRVRKEKVAVITNASLMRKKSVRNSLARADLVAAKMDAYSEKSFRKINRPAKAVNFKDAQNGMKIFRKTYKGVFALQIMFIPQNKKHFRKMAEIAYAVRPDEIEINTPTRPNPVKALSKNDIAGIAGYFRAYGKSINAAVKVRSVYEEARKRVSAMNRKDTIRRRSAAV